MKHIYLMLSATPYRMGKIIRLMTNSRYNHISFALDRNLKEMYSFARYHINAPFYGGFVHEDSQRFVFSNTPTAIKIYRLPVSDESYNLIQNEIQQISRSCDTYQYNMANAILHIFDRGIELENCFNCLEFSAYLLQLAHYLPKEIPLYAYSFYDMQLLFDDFLIFQGNFEDYTYTKVKDSSYLQKLTFKEMCTLTFKQNALVALKVLFAFFHI